MSWFSEQTPSKQAGKWEVILVFISETQHLAMEQGRDPASVSIAVFGQPPDTTRAQVEDFLNAGAVRVAVWPTHCTTEQAMGEQLARMADALVR